MARIVAASNFNEEWFNESFVLDFTMKEECAKEIAASLNKYESGERSRIWFKVVDNDYKLHIGMVP